MNRFSGSTRVSRNLFIFAFFWATTCLIFFGWILYQSHERTTIVEFSKDINAKAAEMIEENLNRTKLNRASILNIENFTRQIDHKLDDIEKRLAHIERTLNIKPPESQNNAMKGRPVR